MTIQNPARPTNLHSKRDVDLVGIYDGALRSGVIVLRTSPAMSKWVLFSLEDGGYGFARPDRLPNGAILADHLAVRRWMIDEEAKCGVVRAHWKPNLTQPLESLADVLMQVVGRHIGEGRAPRSNRRVVRAGASSRDGPSSSGGVDPPEHHPHDHDDVVLRLPGGAR
jgi:hypothetical protein